MTPADERATRAKGVQFIVQVGIMLKLPQLTLSTAAVYFHRFLMRASLKRPRDGIPKLHHFQSAAVALFLATKSEESTRKLRDLILACCRVAQKNPHLHVDEQSKDWWRWRDCLLLHEDLLLETLCFDLALESPHRILFDLLKRHDVAHRKPLRNAAWAFVTDALNTEVCLMVSARGIAGAGLWVAGRRCGVELREDWWRADGVGLGEVRMVVEFMGVDYEGRGGEANGGWEVVVGKERRGSGVSEVGTKREREEGEEEGFEASTKSSRGNEQGTTMNGVAADGDGKRKRARLADDDARSDRGRTPLPPPKIEDVNGNLKHEEKKLMVDGETREEEAQIKAEASEEGEVEE